MNFIIFQKSIKLPAQSCSLKRKLVPVVKDPLALEEPPKSVYVMNQPQHILDSPIQYTANIYSESKDFSSE